VFACVPIPVWDACGLQQVHEEGAPKTEEATRQAHAETLAPMYAETALHELFCVLRVTCVCLRCEVSIMWGAGK